MDSEVIAKIDAAFSKYSKMTKEEVEAFWNVPMDFVEEEVYVLLRAAMAIEVSYSRLLALGETEGETKAISEHLTQCLSYVFKNIPRTFVLAYAINKLNRGENVRNEQSEPAGGVRPSGPDD